MSPSAFCRLGRDFQGGEGELLGNDLATVYHAMERLGNTWNDCAEFDY